jgi:hypothetical protein
MTYKFNIQGNFMTILSRRTFLGSMVAVPALAADEGWTPLFDGKSLNGWRANENAAAWSVKNGWIETSGARSHLFYQGRLANASFKNFELKADVMTRPNANGGIFFHTKYQPSGWPEKGFEVQVYNAQSRPTEYGERRKTGSLLGVRNIYKSLVKDDDWCQLHIMVRGKNVQIRLNDILLVDYVEPDSPVRVNKEQERILGTGTFALQAHDAGSQVRYRNILVRPLPDNLTAPSTEKPVVDDVYMQLLRLSDQNFPLVDYHVHLKEGWTLEEALQESRRLGIQYGIAVNCGIGFPITDDNGAREFLNTMKGQPVFVVMQVEGREWVKTFSKEVIAMFDYVITDAMTFTDDRGRRMRIWLDDEVGEIPDRQQFMNVIVDRTLGVLNREPIDIFVNPTFLPTLMANDYDALWTPERMGKVVDAAKKNNIAIEINNRYRIPSASFIKLAKQAGVKFSLGTNNTDRKIGRLEYSAKMVDECGLTGQDIFVPSLDGEKPIQKRGL